MKARITPEQVRDKIASLESRPPTEETAFYLMLLHEFQDKADSRPPIRLPYCSASPVCEIEAGYAAGVSDCREAIRQAGYPIEGDD